jgi:mycothiol synthase
MAATGYTGVLRAYRGRGVATALKVAAVQWARARGMAYIYTGNDLTNAPMLAINSQLGFEPLPASAQLVKHL